MLSPMDNTEDYSDIINLPHHVSDTRKQMPMESRAAQFAPFSALEGFEESIEGAIKLDIDDS